MLLLEDSALLDITRGVREVVAVSTKCASCTGLLGTYVIPIAGWVRHVRVDFEVSLGASFATRTFLLQTPFCRLRHTYLSTSFYYISRTVF